MNAILLFLSFLFLPVSSVSASEYEKIPNDTLFRVPLVRYSPAHFGDELDYSFTNSLVYIEVERLNNDTTYTLVSYGNRDNQHSFTTETMERLKMPISLIWSGDSVVFVDFETPLYDDTHLKECPLCYVFAVKRNGKYLFGNIESPNELMSFQEYIIKRYGSASKFREVVMGVMKYNMDIKKNFWVNHDLREDLYPEIRTRDNDGMLSWLKTDYAFYEMQHPKDTLGVVDRFMKLLDTFVAYERGQRDFVYRRVLDDVKSGDPFIKNFHIPQKKEELREHIVVLGTNMVRGLEQCLTKEQFGIVMRNMFDNNYLRKSYTRDLVWNLYPQTMTHTPDVPFSYGEDDDGLNEKMKSIVAKIGHKGVAE